MLSTYKYIEYKTTRKNDVKNVKILSDVHMWPIQRSHRTSLENDTVRDISNKGDLMERFSILPGLRTKVLTRLTCCFIFNIFVSG